MPPKSHTEAVLVHFAGPDAFGLTAELTRLLAQSDVGILDIGQDVVHESLSLGMLLELPAGVSVASLKTIVGSRARELGLQARFKVVPHGALSHWMRGLRRHHFIVTVLGPSISAHQLARISAILTAHEMNIDRIERLSSHLQPDREAAGACIQLDVSGNSARELAMRADFLAAADELSIDIAFQRESIYVRNRRLFAFDMDSTLIQGEVIDELARLAGVGEQVARITEAAMRGELNFDESFTRRVALLKGLPAERAHGLLDAIPLADGAERLFRTLRLLGYKTAILSGGFTFFASHLQHKLGIDYMHANSLEVVDGAATGRIVPPIVNGARKAELLREIAAQENISIEQVVAVGDGANDIPMLSIAGMGVAYRAKPLVRARAGHSIAALGLDSLLYLVGVRDWDLHAHDVPTPGSGS